MKMLLFSKTIQCSTLTYHRSTITDPNNPTVCVAIQDNPGHIQVRSHFERVREFGSDSKDASDMSVPSCDSDAMSTSSVNEEVEDETQASEISDSNSATDDFSFVNDPVDLQPVIDHDEIRQ